MLSNDSALFPLDGSYAINNTKLLKVSTMQVKIEKQIVQSDSASPPAAAMSFVKEERLNTTEDKGNAV